MKALIFDFDGVIIDSEPLWDRYLWEVSKQCFPGLQKSIFDHLSGLSLAEGYEYLCAHVAPTLSMETYLAESRTFIPKIYADSPLEEGIADILKELQKQRIPVCIASSSRKSWVEPTLQKHKLSDYFLHLSTIDEVTRGKPAPDVYLLAAEKLGLPPGECMAIEDSKNGVAAARAAGVYCIGYIPEGRPVTLPDAHEIITHHKELLPIMEKFFPGARA
jgi:HAD superfamily hydrolase (TIGR01509 family)